MNKTKLLSEIRPINLREQVVEQIRLAIIEGRLRPGDHMVEAQLTKHLSVSRTPLREALILLEREGLVETIPNKGTFVRRFSINDVEAIFSMRIMLENFAAERIIDVMTDLDFETLDSLIREQKAYINQNDFRRVRATDMQFHHYILKRSDHSQLLRSWTEIVAQIAALLYMRAETTRGYDEAKVIVDHQTILRAYRDRNLIAVKTANKKINERVAEECRHALIEHIPQKQELSVEEVL